MTDFFRRIKGFIHQPWFAVLILVAIGLSLYLPQMGDLGYYRDDWNNIFNADSRGSEMLIDHYAIDRPADGYLLAAAYDVFGANSLPYRLINLASRILAAVCFSLTIAIVWKRPTFAVFASGALFLVFPGYLRQVDGITYLPHQLAMAAMMASIYLSVWALTLKRVLWRGIAIISAVALSMSAMLLMEYYIGMEALRFCFIWAYGANRNRRTFWPELLNVIISYLPYLIGTMLFFIWRSFLFEAVRAGTDLASIFDQFRHAPRYVLSTWIQKTLMNLFKLLAGSWVIPPYHLLNGIDVRFFFKILLQVALPTLLFAASFLIMTRERKAGPEPAKDASADQKPGMRWQVQWILIGLFSALVEILLLVVATREITFASSLDRFTYHASFSAVMVLIGVIALIEGRMVKFFLLTGVVLFAVLSQRATTLNYVRQTELENDFWWQLSWRIPDLEDGTMVLLHNAGFSAEEDYENFVPLYLIYRRKQGYVQIVSDVLNESTIRAVKAGSSEDRVVRQIYLFRDYANVVAVTKPTPKSCLQLIDGANPIYSPLDYSRIDEVGFASDLNLIHLDKPGYYPNPSFFGAEPTHESWCYAYAQMGLAQQRGDFAAAAKLADDAIAAGYHAEDPVEWIPVVQAFAYSGRIEEETRGYLAILKTDSYLRFQSCGYFRRAGESLELDETEAAGNRFLIEELCEN